MNLHKQIKVSFLTAKQSIGH